MEKNKDKQIKIYVELCETEMGLKLAQTTTRRRPIKYTKNDTQF